MNKNYGHLLFVDLETVPQAQHYTDLNDESKKLFEGKVRSKLLQKSESHTGTKEEALSELYLENAALYAEFCQIVSVGIGYIAVDELRIKTVVSKNEVDILTEICRIMNLGNFSFLVGHNSDNFDFPLLCRRLIINRMKIPNLLDPTGKKPWERCWKDTMEIWGYGEWNYKCSLDRLCHVLGVPSPKQEMDGSMVKDLFYGATPGPEDLPFGKFDKEPDRFALIAKYQAGDVLATANCYLRLQNERIIPETNVVLV